MSLLNYLKDYSKGIGPDNQGIPILDRAYIVTYTRQQVAKVNGLRAETVIRTVNRMQSEGKLRLINRKISV